MTDSLYMNVKDGITYEEAMNFKFIPVSAEQAELITGADRSYFAKSGIYRVLSGSRGVIEEVVLQEDKLEILTKEEAIQSMIDDDMPGGMTKEEIQDAKNYVEEWYYIDIDPEFSGALTYGYTEEDYDTFVQVI